LGAGGDGRQSQVAARDLLSAAASVAAAGTAVEVSIATSDPISPLSLDLEQMTQAFRSLIRNSVEAMTPPPRRPQVQLRAANVALAEGQVAGLPAGDYVEFEVRDNGNGIAPENLEKVWEPFFTTRKHGSGLGLSTALAIVRHHGGQIGLDSTVGVGTVVTVFLPSRHPLSAVSARPAPSQRFRTGRILAMDDDPEIRAATGALLQKLEYKFDVSPDGADALAAYRRYFDIGRPYDVVLLDQNVRGGMGGEETLEHLRALDPDIRAIAVVTDSGESVARACLARGFCGCLVKPYRLVELAEALQAVLK
jgi:CheY-like chemotaxis protein